MKLLKFIPLLLVLTFPSSNANADQNCDEIKGNIVGKLFCKAQANIGSESSGSESSGSESSGTESSSSSAEESTGWKIWKKPEWMKKKN